MAELHTTTTGPPRRKPAPLQPHQFGAFPGSSVSIPRSQTSVACSPPDDLKADLLAMLSPEPPNVEEDLGLDDVDK